MYVTMRRIYATILAVEKQKQLHIPKVFVALSIQHAMYMCHIVFYELCSCTIFLHIISSMAQFGGGGFLCVCVCACVRARVHENKMFVLIFFTTIVSNISHYKNEKDNQKCISVFT
jgi:hypothetical protein